MTKSDVQLIEPGSLPHVIRRYLVFACYDYYPAGGWGDFAGACDTLEEARKLCDSMSNHEDCEIVDLVSLEVVDIK